MNMLPKITINNYVQVYFNLSPSLLLLSLILFSFPLYLSFFTPSLLPSGSVISVSEAGGPAPALFLATRLQLNAVKGLIPVTLTLSSGA